MKTPHTPDATEDGYLGLGEAAQLLGLSRTSVQKLVDTGHVAAVRTVGGHRRILRSSLLAYRQHMGRAPARGVPAPGTLAQRAAGTQPFEVLVVDDDEVTIQFVATLVKRNFPGFLCTVARDGMEAVLQIERRRPHIVITDLNMQPFDGFRLARHIHDQPEYAGICVVALSALSDKEIARRGGLPQDVLLYRKPLTAERLLGFLEAHAQVLRKAGARG